jgi:hypothetical protein
MQSVVLMSQLHANDSEFGARIGSAPHLRRKAASFR